MSLTGDIGEFGCLQPPRVSAEIEGDDMTEDQVRATLAAMASNCGAKVCALLPGERWYFAYIGDPIKKAGVGHTPQDALDDLSVHLCKLDDSFPRLAQPVDSEKLTPSLGTHN
jgi:hypothetical protein